MISSWRKRRASRRAVKDANEGGCSGEIKELAIPNYFKCPLSLDLMKDPVTLSTRITYDRESIEKWIENGNDICPITNRVLKTLEPIPNHTIRKMIQDWCIDNRSYGIERVLTPKFPVSSREVSEILSKIEIMSSSRDEDQAAYCRDLVAKIKRSAKESERNKRCIVSNGTNRVLTAAFDKFSPCLDGDDNNRIGVLDEILSTLTTIGLNSVDNAAISRLGTASSLSTIVWFLKSGDLSRRRNAVLVLKEIKNVNLVMEIEGGMEALFKVIKEPICRNSTKASLIIIYHVITSSSKSKDRAIAKFVEMGLVELLLETLVDAQRSTCEKTLGILNGICSTETGRQRAYANALTVPILVKKILRVSELATEFAVLVLWKLCRNGAKKQEKSNKIDDENEDGVVSGAIVEALKVGVFQKLLLLLQVGSGGERTKEKVTELLKVLNLHRDKLECTGSMDFKNLKTPF